MSNSRKKDNSTLQIVVLLSSFYQSYPKIPAVYRVSESLSFYERGKFFVSSLATFPSFTIDRFYDA